MPTSLVESGTARLPVLLALERPTHTDIDDIIFVLSQGAVSRSSYQKALYLKGPTLEQLSQIVELFLAYGGGEEIHVFTALAQQDTIPEELLARVLYHREWRLESNWLTGQCRILSAQAGWLTPVVYCNESGFTRTTQDALVRVENLRSALDHDSLALSVCAEIGMSDHYGIADVISATRTLCTWLRTFNGDLDTLRDVFQFSDAALIHPPDEDVLGCYAHYLRGRPGEIDGDTMVNLMRLPGWTPDTLIALSDGLSNGWPQGAAAIVVHPQANIAVIAHVQTLNVYYGGGGSSLDQALTQAGSLIPTVCKFFGVYDDYPKADKAAQRLSEGLAQLLSTLGDGPVHQRVVVSLSPTWAGSLDELLATACGIATA